MRKRSLVVKLLIAIPVLWLFATLFVADKQSGKDSEVKVRHDARKPQQHVDENNAAFDNINPLGNDVNALENNAIVNNLENNVKPFENTGNFAPLGKLENLHPRNELVVQGKESAPREVSEGLQCTLY